MQPAQGDRPPSARKGVFPSSRGSGRGRQRGDCVLPRRRGPLFSFQSSGTPRDPKHSVGFLDQGRRLSAGPLKRDITASEGWKTKQTLRILVRAFPGRGCRHSAPEGRKQTPSPEPCATHRDWRLKRRKAPRRPPARPLAALTPGSSVPFATSLVVCVHRLPTVNKG